MRTQIAAISVVIVALIAGAYFYKKSHTPVAAPAASSETASTSPAVYTYHCSDNQEYKVSFSPDMSNMAIEPSAAVGVIPPTVLPSASTTSGVLYTKGTVSFTGRGETVQITRGTSTAECLEVHADDDAPFNFGD